MGRWDITSKRLWLLGSFVIAAVCILASVKTAVQEVLPEYVAISSSAVRNSIVPMRTTVLILFQRKFVNTIL